MKFESEPGTSKIVKTSTGKKYKGSLVKNLGSDLGIWLKNDSHINNVILINFKNFKNIYIKWVRA